MTPCDPPITEGKAIFKRRQYFLGDARAHVKNIYLYIYITRKGAFN